MKMTNLDRQKIKIGFIYALIFGVAVFLRIYKITELPYGLNIDEAGAAYDAFGIATEGVDRFYKFYPVYLINYGGGQSALYAYLIAILIKLTGTVNVFLIRMPAVICSVLMWTFGTLILKKVFSHKITMLGAFILAIAPCFVMLGRIAMDCDLFLSLSTIALYIFICAIEKKKNWMYILSGVSLGVTLYTYALSYLAVPIFLSFTFIYLFKTKKIKWSNVFSLGIPLGIIATPLILMNIVNMFDLPEIRLAYMTITKLPGYRGAEITLTDILTNVKLLVDTYFFYDGLMYNGVDRFFTLYVVSIPFAILGIQRVIKLLWIEKRWKEEVITVIVGIWLVAQTIMGLVIYSPCINKMNAVYFSLAFFIVYGIYDLYEKCKKIKKEKIFYIGTLVVYMCFGLAFGKFYFTEYTDAFQPLSFFGDTYDEILDKYEEEIGDKQVYVNYSYLYYALGEKLRPTEFQLLEQGSQERGNVHFYYPEEMKNGDVYLIPSGDHATTMKKELKELGYKEIEEGFYNVYIELD